MGTSSTKVHDELAWKPLSIRRELHTLHQFYKIVKNLAPHYSTELLPKLSRGYKYFRLKSRENFTQFPCRKFYISKVFFLHPLSLARIVCT